MTFVKRYSERKFDFYRLQNLELPDFTKADHLEEIFAPKEMLKGNYDNFDKQPKQNEFARSCGHYLPDIFNMVGACEYVVTPFNSNFGCGCLKSNYECMYQYDYPGGKNSWMAAEKPNLLNPCRELHQQDVRRGTCYNIKYTSEYSVLCEEGYHGDHCENVFEPPTSDENLAPLYKLLGERSWKGLPGLVDVWLDVHQLGDKINGINQAIEENTNELKFLLKHRTALGHVIYIIEQYDRYMSDSEVDKISGDTFMHNIHSHFKQQPIFRFFYDLNEALKDKYLRYQKKKIAELYPICSNKYQERVKSFKKYTEMMETVIRATLMMYINTEKYKEDIDQNENIWTDTEKEIKKDFELQKYWRDGSCPTIYPFDRKSKGYCSETESFEGAEIREFNCDGKKDLMWLFHRIIDSEKKYSNIKKAICREKNGKLEWETEMSNTCER